MRWRRWLGAGHGQLVLDGQPPGAVRVEGDDGLAGADALERVAVVAHWAPGHRVGLSVAELVGALLRK
jgi:hypothetical protein